jgi:hypothetical protein
MLVQMGLIFTVWRTTTACFLINGVRFYLISFITTKKGVGIMPSKDQPIAVRVTGADVALKNASSTTGILNAMSVYNYDKKRLAKGKQIVAEAQRLIAANEREYGEQFEATDRFRKIWDNAKEVYNKTRAIAKIAFKDNRGALGGMRLLERKKESISGWLNQAKIMYRNMVKKPEYLKEMRAFGYTKTKLAQEAKMIEKVAKANADQEREKGEAQASTKLRDTAIEKFDDWMEDFYGVAVIALSDKPQWLEKLGIKEAS